MTPPPRIAILIVSWNAHDLLARCLGSLAPAGPRSLASPTPRILEPANPRIAESSIPRILESSHPFPYPVIVVDNASADGSAEMVATRFPHATLVREAANLGFAGGVNRARRETQAERLLLLNPDTMATRESIERLATALDEDPAIGAVGGRLINPDGTLQAGFSARRFPTLGSLAMDLLLVDQIWPRNPITRRYLGADWPDDEPVDVDQPAAACLMLRALAFDAVGGMDERFHPAWFEDVDLCRRLRAAGFRVRYEPGATFTHHGGVAMRTLGLGRFSAIWYENMERYVRRHHGLASWLVLKALLTTGMIARVLVSAFRRDRSAAKAYAGVLRQTLTRWSR
jgi:N-acetylglucosaminyl-diphospho-decaprenol L-rhamnosyltransferase